MEVLKSKATESELSKISNHKMLLIINCYQIFHPHTLERAIKQLSRSFQEFCDHLKKSLNVLLFLFRLYLYFEFIRRFRWQTAVHLRI